MENWVELDSVVYRQVWDKIYEDFNFKPSANKADWPSFTPPSPYLVYDISHLYGPYFEEYYKELETSVTTSFINCMEKDEYIYAPLDWQHSSYWFNPRIDSPRGEFEEWPIALYPNGDYYFFIKKDFTWGYFGHPWEKSICIFGVNLIEEMKGNLPKLFTKLIRNG